MTSPASQLGPSYRRLYEGPGEESEARKPGTAIRADRFSLPGDYDGRPAFGVVDESGKTVITGYFLDDNSEGVRYARPPTPAEYIRDQERQDKTLTPGRKP